MKVIDIEVGKAEFSVDGTYRVVFNDKHKTDLSTKSYEPVFSKNQLHFTSENTQGSKDVVTVSIVSVKDGIETLCGTETVELAQGKEYLSTTVEYSKERGSLLDGMIHMNYKLTKLSLSESLRQASNLCCLNISATILNVLLERAFEIKMLVKDVHGLVVGTAKLNNKAPAAHLDLNRGVLTDGPLELVVSEEATLYSIVVRAGCPVAVAVPSSSGEPVVLMLLLVVGEGVVTGICHSAALREASVALTNTGKRVSLSPRRPSVLPGAAGLSPVRDGGSGAVPSARKSLLYLEDPIASSGSNQDAVLGGIQQALVITTADLEVALEVRMRSLTPPAGPRSGVYLACSSKSEVLVVDGAGGGSDKKKGQKNKKQQHAINLGLIALHHSGLSNPVKLRADLLDYLLDQSSTGGTINKVDAADEPELTNLPSATTANAVTVHNRPAVSYSGVLEETSRERSSEAGLLAVVLEGKLFRRGPGEATTSSLDSQASVRLNAISESGVAPKRAEESCMVVKVYLSLVQNAPRAATPEAATPAAETTVKELSSVGVTETDIHNIDGEILDFAGYASSSKQQTVHAEGAAVDDELPGESVLREPTPPPLGPTETASDSYGELARAKSQSGFGEKLNPRLFHEQLQRLQTEDEQRGRMIASNNALAEIVRAELVEKQKLVERLMEDVRVRTEAIQVVGKDIRELRQENQNLLTKLQAAEEALRIKSDAEAATDQVTERVLQTSTALRDLDRDSLIRTLNQLRDALNTAEEEKVQLQAVLRSAKCSIDAFAALKREHKELQSAHMDQTRLLQRMQGRISKTEVYRNTIEAQEGVITRMQSVIEARIQQNRAQAAGKNTALPLPKPPRDELDSARSKRNSSEPTAELPSSCEKDTVYKSAYLALEGELREASEQVEGLTDRVRELEEQLELARYAAYDKNISDSDGSDEEEDGNEEEEDGGEEAGEKVPRIRNLKDANRKIDQLEAELVSKGFRASALERQLEASTVEYSREIARLRTKLFELEMQASLAGATDSGGDVDVDYPADYDFSGMDVEAGDGDEPRFKSLSKRVPSESLNVSSSSDNVATGETAASRPLTSTRTVSESNKTLSRSSSRTLSPPTPVAVEATTEEEPVAAVDTGSININSNTTRTTTAEPPSLGPVQSTGSADGSVPPVDEEPALTPPVQVALEPSTQTAPETGVVDVRPAVTDVEMQKTIDIIDMSPTADEGSRGNKCADLTFSVRYSFDPETGRNKYVLKRIELTNFAQTENKARFQPFLEFSLPSIAGFSLKTEVVRDASLPSVVWDFGGKEKTLTVTEEQLVVNSQLQCLVRKVSDDKLGSIIGKGFLSLRF